jgi:hypothetical protein
LADIRREHGVRPLRQAKPLETEPLSRLLEPIDADTLAGLRDRALLLLGFAAALPRTGTSPSIGSLMHQGWQTRGTTPRS